MGRDFHVQKTVGAIRIRDEIADVRVEQRLAVAAMRQKASRLLDLHPRSNQFFAESSCSPTIVNFNSLCRSPASMSYVTRISPADAGFFCRVTLAVEVAQALHVIEQIAPAFVQQIIVQRIFFIDRNVLLELDAADLETLDCDLDFRSRLDFKA